MDAPTRPAPHADDLEEIRARLESLELRAPRDADFNARVVARLHELENAPTAATRRAEQLEIATRMALAMSDLLTMSESNTRAVDSLVDRSVYIAKRLVAKVEE